MTTNTSGNQGYTLRMDGKNILVAYALWFFVGYLGLHRLYLGRKGSAFTQLGLFIGGLVLLFVLIGFVPLLALLVWLLIDALLIPGYVAEHNRQHGIADAAIRVDRTTSA